MAKENESATTIQTTADLRRMLIETITDVRSGTIDAKQARTIAALSTTILHSAKLDLDMLKFNIAHNDTHEASKNVLTLVSG